MSIEAVEQLTVVKHILQVNQIYLRYFSLYCNPLVHLSSGYHPNIQMFFGEEIQLLLEPTRVKKGFFIDQRFWTHLEYVVESGIVIK